MHCLPIYDHIRNSHHLYFQNAPFSALICGVQGSGKSHSVGVLLENALTQDRRLGIIEKPLAALVLHFGESGANSKPCEAAYQALRSNRFDPLVKPPRVVVYCSPSSLIAISKVYAPLGSSIKILPLTFDEHELDAESFLAMMGVDGSSENVPLYVKIILVSRFR